MGEEKKYSTMLPDGWVLLEFKETCEKISLNGIKIKQKQYLFSGKYPVIDQGQDNIGGYFNDETLVVPNKPPYIVFGDHTKVKKYINFRFIAGADGVKVIKPYDYFEPKLFYHFLHCIKLPDKGYARHFQFLKKSEFPLPPLPEQHRIVAKIEELFSSLDKGIENLKTAQAQLKTYRQAVLKWAFEGKLTNENVKDGELPEGWKWQYSADLFEYVTSGSRGWAKYYANDGSIFLRMGNLDHDTIKIDLSDIQYVKLPNKAEGTRSLVHSGDILISITADVGMVGIVPEGFPEGYINQHVALARPIKEIVQPSFIAWYFASKENGQKQLRELQRGATKVGLGLNDIKSINVPIPPLFEQHRIVSEIETRLSVCDKLEESITQSLLQAEALRQSILKKAFEGKLVPQDPDDEPASALLERIRAERAAMPAKNATRNNRKSKCCSHCAELKTK